MITFAAFTVIMLVGVPIGLCLCLAGFVYIMASGNPVLFQSYPLQLFGGVDSYGLIAIPLFILIGEIMNGGGITKRIVDMAMAFVGSLKGGLAYVNILANMFISSILGSATAQVAIMAQIMVPEMEKKGYDKTFAAGLTAYGGMLGPIIPPSVMFVVYSVLAQVSVSDMLIAGIIPGVILTGMFCVVIALMGYIYNYPRAEYQTPKQRVMTILRTCADAADSRSSSSAPSSAVWRTQRNRLPSALSPLLLIGKYWTKEFEWSQLPQMMLRSGIYSAIVLFLVAAAAVFSWVLIFGKVPQETAAWIQTVAKDPISFMLICNVILLVIGTVIDGVPGLIMTVPILLPVATEIYHIDPRHFGVVVVINLVLGLLSPPVGLCFFVAAAVTGAKPGKMFMVTLPFFFISCILSGAALALSVSVARPHQVSPIHQGASVMTISRRRFLAASQLLRCSRRRWRIGAGQGAASRPDHAERPFLEQGGAEARRSAEGRDQGPPNHDGVSLRPARQRSSDDAAAAVRRARYGLHPGCRTRLARAAYRGDQRALYRALHASRGEARASSGRGETVRRAAAETGTIGLGWGITGMRAVFSVKDLNTLADIKGMKLRINPTPVYRDFYSSLGAAPTPIPTPQVFDAMSNGQVDGLEADLEFSWNQRFDKVSKSSCR
jgi:C4-dicarboxylate transporter DctM subunit